MAKIRTHGWWIFKAKDLKEKTNYKFHLILSFMNIHAKLHPLAVSIHVVGGISVLQDSQNHGWWIFKAKDLKEKTNYKFHLILSFMNIHAKLHPLAVFIHVVGGIPVLQDSQNQNTWMVEIFGKRSERNNKSEISFIKSCFRSAFKAHCIKHMLSMIIFKVNLSHDIVSGSDVTPSIKIHKPLVVTDFGYLMK